MTRLGLERAFSAERILNFGTLRRFPGYSLCSLCMPLLSQAASMSQINPSGINSFVGDLQVGQAGSQVCRARSMHSLQKTSCRDQVERSAKTLVDKLCRRLDPRICDARKIMKDHERSREDPGWK